MNPDVNTPQVPPPAAPPAAAAPMPAPTAPVAPAAPVAPVVPPPAPKSKLLWLLLALLLLAIFAGGAYFFMMTQKQASTPEPMMAAPTEMPVTATPEVSTSDDLDVMEKELDSTQVNEDTSGYTQIETELQGL